MKQKKAIDTLLPMVENTETNIAKGARIKKSYFLLTGKKVDLKEVIDYIAKK